jgi:hypothetical protein
MAINGLPASHRIGYGQGLASTNAMVVQGINSGDNLLAVISFGAGGVTPVGQDKTDFTVAAGTITAGTIDLSSLDFVAIWTEAPAT